MTQLLTLQLIAHFLADFLFQSEKPSNEKNKGVISKSHLLHIIIVFICSYVLSFQPEFILFSFAITIIHLAIDMVESYLVKTTKRNIFFIVQTVHLLTIYLVINFALPQKLYTLPFEVDYKILYIILGYILCLKPSNIIIKNIFEIFKIKVSATGLPNAGKLIGMTERILVLTFILSYNYEVVGFIIAAKSILRFKDTDTENSEYVLVGTLLSFGIAILLGVIINLL